MSLWIEEEVQEVLHEVKRNRHKKQEPKLGRFWCPGCDAYLLSKGGKCPVCKTRDKSKRRKHV